MKMEKLPSDSRERIPPHHDFLLPVELFLQTNREYLKDLRAKLKNLGISAAAVSRVLRLPVDMVDDDEE